MYYTIVPLKLDFVGQKKGAWLSRPCGDWSTCLHLALGTKEQTAAHRRCLRIGRTRCAPLLKSKSKLLLVLAYLSNEGGVLLASDHDGAGVPNFRITANVALGIYYAKVTGYDNATSGAYTLMISR